MQNEEIELNEEIEEIESIECIGEFEDEYVYDVEVGDETHTFFANDILVHNSAFCSFEEPWNACDHSYDEPRKFILDMYEYRLEQYFIDCFTKYAKKKGLSENFLDFELEKIANKGIFVASKKYALDITWKDRILYEPLTNISYTGLEIVQSSTPKFARKILEEMSKYLLTEDPKEQVLIKKLNKFKEEFKLLPIDEIAFGRKVNNYKKFVLKDSKELSLASGTPIHVRAAGIYNHTVKNSKYSGKYDLIHSGDFIKYYHSKSSNSNLYVFGFIPNSYPIEFGLPVNYDLQFEKAVIDPLNRMIVAYKDFGVLNPELYRLKTLF